MSELEIFDALVNALSDLQEKSEKLSAVASRMSALRQEQEDRGVIWSRSWSEPSHVPLGEVCLVLDDARKSYDRHKYAQGYFDDWHYSPLRMDPTTLVKELNTEVGYGAQLMERTVKILEKRVKAAQQPNTHLFVQGDLSMDTYNTGQAGSVGPHATADNTTFNNATPAAVPKDLDLPAELERLQTAMYERAKTPEEQAAVKKIARAKTAADDGDTKGALGYLKAAGEWALKVGEEVMSKVAVEFIRHSIGV